MAKKKIWSYYMDIVSGKVVHEQPVPEKEWQMLFDQSDTFYKCREGYHWTTKINGEWQKKLYEKMKQLSQGTFNHVRVLARLTRYFNEPEFLSKCLDQMIPLAEKTPKKAWWREIIEYLENDDPRRTDAQKQLDALCA